MADALGAILRRTDIIRDALESPAGEPLASALPGLASYQGPAKSPGPRRTPVIHEASELDQVTLELLGSIHVVGGRDTAMHAMDETGRSRARDVALMHGVDMSPAGR